MDRAGFVDEHVHLGYCEMHYWKWITVQRVFIICLLNNMDANANINHVFDIKHCTNPWFTEAAEGGEQAAEQPEKPGWPSVDTEYAHF